MTDELAGMWDKITDLVHKLSGPMAEEAGMMLGDKVRVYRVKNWINTVRKTERLLRDSRPICKRPAAEIVPANHGGLLR